MKTVCPLQPTHSPASPSSLCRSFFHICSEPLFSLCLLSCSPTMHHWRAWPFPLINFFVGIGRLISGSPKPSLFHVEEVPFSQPLLISWLLQPQPSLLNLLKFKTDYLTIFDNSRSIWNAIYAYICIHISSVRFSSTLLNSQTVFLLDNQS